MTLNDQMYGSVANAKASGYRSLTFAVGVTGSYLNNNFTAQLFSVTPHNNGMLNILLMCNPSQIGRSIIRLVKIFMMHTSKVPWIRDESYRHKLGNKKCFLSAFFAKNQMQIAFFIRHTQNLFAAFTRSMAAFVRDKAVNSSDVSKVGDFIEALVSHNRTPSLTLFNYFGLHSAEYSAWRPMAQG